VLGSDRTMLRRRHGTRTNAIVKRLLLRLRLMPGMLMALRRMRIGRLRSVA